MYADTITLFNRYDTGAGDVWFPTVLKGVDLNVDKAAIIAKYGENSGDNARLHIRCGIDDGAITVGDKTYLPPKVWKTQSRNQAASSVTFASGQSFDFFVVGEWGDTGAISDDDYLEGFYSFCNNVYDFCFAITSVAMYSVIPHFEIMAK